MHGLIQAFSRTNRILNSVKTYGNIVCFRNLEEETNKAIALFGDRNAGSIVLLKNYKAYYDGYDEDGKHHDGYEELIAKLQDKFPLGQPIVGEQNKKTSSHCLAQFCECGISLPRLMILQAMSCLPRAICKITRATILTYTNSCGLRTLIRKSSMTI